MEYINMTIEEAARSVVTEEEATMETCEKREFKPLIIENEWVLQPIKNAFNSKISFWLSRKGYAISAYCFSCKEGDWEEYDYQVKNINSYKRLFNSMTTASAGAL